MAGGTLPLAKEDLLTAQLIRRRSRGVQATSHIEFGRRREVEHILHLRHMGHLDAQNNRKPFLHGMDRVPVKIRGAKLELGKTLHGAQAALRAVNLLVEQAPQADCIETKAPLLRGRSSGFRWNWPVVWPFT